MSEQFFSKPIEGDLSFKEVIDFFLDSWKVIAASVILGGGMALGYIFVTPPKYAAIASIQVAKVAGLIVEEPAVLIEKLRIPTYFSKSTHAACNASEQIEPGEIVAKNIKPVLSKTAPIIHLTYHDDSRENARICLESILNDIRNNQDLLSKPVLEAINLNITIKKEKLRVVEKDLEELRAKNSNFDFSDLKFSASAFLFGVISAKKLELDELKNRIFELENSLLEHQSRRLLLISELHVSKNKVSPRRFMILLAGILSGLLSGLFLIIVKRSYSAHKNTTHI